MGHSWGNLLTKKCIILAAMLVTREREKLLTGRRGGEDQESPRMEDWVEGRGQKPPALTVRRG